jgi:hypothetical protein
MKILITLSSPVSNNFLPLRFKYSGIAQWYSAGLRAGWLGFDSRQGLAIFLFTATSRPVLGPTHPPIQWVPGALSLGVRPPKREVDHSSPSSDEVKNAWSYTSTLPVRLHGVVLSWSTGTTLPLPCSQTPSVYVLPLMWDTAYTYIQNNR